MRTRVKICGITRPEDGRSAAAQGADAIGLVFCETSPRALDRGRAEAIIRALPPFVTVVGLFLDPEREQVAAAVEALPLDLLQFHGDEPAELCAAFGRRYIKAVPMGAPVDVDAYMARHPEAAGFLLDAHARGERGGRGERFDWRRFPADGGRPLILAGGLGPENVGEAVLGTRPWGVDVSSGVESRPGVKDAARVAAFIREVDRATAE